MTLHWTREIESWLRHLKAGGRPKTTIELRGYHLRRMARELDDVSPWEVTPEALVDWFGGKTWARETRRSHRASARSFWGWGLAIGRTAVNPALALESVRRQPPRPKPTPSPAFKRAMYAARERERLMLRLVDEAGLRRGEVCQVHRRDLVEDLAGWSLVVHGKGSKERLVPLTDDLAMAIRLSTRDGYAFPGRIDGHLSPAHVGKLISRLLPEGASMHGIRHRFATRAYRQTGGDTFVVQQLLGHSSPETTRLYVLVDDNRLRATIEGMNRAS